MHRSNSPSNLASKGGSEHAEGAQAKHISSSSSCKASAPASRGGADVEARGLYNQPPFGHERRSSARGCEQRDVQSSRGAIVPVRSSMESLGIASPRLQVLCYVLAELCSASTVLEDYTRGLMNLSHRLLAVWQTVMAAAATHQRCLRELQRLARRAAVLHWRAAMRRKRRRAERRGSGDIPGRENRASRTRAADVAETAAGTAAATGLPWDVLERSQSTTVAELAAGRRTRGSRASSAVSEGARHASGATSTASSCLVIDSERGSAEERALGTPGEFSDAPELVADRERREGSAERKAAIRQPQSALARSPYLAAHPTHDHPTHDRTHAHAGGTPAQLSEEEEEKERAYGSARVAGGQRGTSAVDKHTSAEKPTDFTGTSAPAGGDGSHVPGGRPCSATTRGGSSLRWSGSSQRRHRSRTRRHRRTHHRRRTRHHESPPAHQAADAPARGALLRRPRSTYASSARDEPPGAALVFTVPFSCASREYLEREDGVARQVEALRQIIVAALFQQYLHVTVDDSVNDLVLYRWLQPLAAAERELADAHVMTAAVRREYAKLAREHSHHGAQRTPAGDGAPTGGTAWPDGPTKGPTDVTVARSSWQDERGAHAVQAADGGGSGFAGAVASVTSVASTTAGDRASSAAADIGKSPPVLCSPACTQLSVGNFSGTDGAAQRSQQRRLCETPTRDSPLLHAPPVAPRQDSDTCVDRHTPHMHVLAARSRSRTSATTSPRELFQQRLKDQQQHSKDRFVELSDADDDDADRERAQTQPHEGDGASNESPSVEANTPQHLLPAGLSWGAAQTRLCAKRPRGSSDDTKASDELARAAPTATSVTLPHTPTAATHDGEPIASALAAEDQTEPPAGQQRAACDTAVHSTSPIHTRRRPSVRDSPSCSTSSGASRDGAPAATEYGEEGPLPVPLLFFMQTAVTVNPTVCAFSLMCRCVISARHVCALDDESPAERGDRYHEFCSSVGSGGRSGVFSDASAGRGGGRTRDVCSPPETDLLEDAEASEYAGMFHVVIARRAVGGCEHALPCFGNRKFIFVPCDDADAMVRGSDTDGEEGLHARECGSDASEAGEGGKEPLHATHPHEGDAENGVTDALVLQPVVAEEVVEMEVEEEEEEPSGVKDRTGAPATDAEPMRRLRAGARTASQPSLAAASPHRAGGSRTAGLSSARTPAADEAWRQRMLSFGSELAAANATAPATSVAASPPPQAAERDEEVVGPIPSESPLPLTLAPMLEAPLLTGGADGRVDPAAPLASVHTVASERDAPRLQYGLPAVRCSDGAVGPGRSVTKAAAVAELDSQRGSSYFSSPRPSVLTQPQLSVSASSPLMYGELNADDTFNLAGGSSATALYSMTEGEGAAGRLSPAPKTAVSPSACAGASREQSEIVEDSDTVNDDAESNVDFIVMHSDLCSIGSAGPPGSSAHSPAAIEDRTRRVLVRSSDAPRVDAGGQAVAYPPGAAHAGLQLHRPSALTAFEQTVLMPPGGGQTFHAAPSTAASPSFKSASRTVRPPTVLTADATIGAGGVDPAMTQGIHAAEAQDVAEEGKASAREHRHASAAVGAERACELEPGDGDLSFAMELYARMQFWCLRGQCRGGFVDPSHYAQRAGTDGNTTDGGSRAADRQEGGGATSQQGTGADEDSGFPPAQHDSAGPLGSGAPGRAARAPAESDALPPSAANSLVLPFKLLNSDVGSIAFFVPPPPELPLSDSEADRQEGISPGSTSAHGGGAREGRRRDGQPPPPWATPAFNERGQTLLREALMASTEVVVCASRECRAHRGSHDRLHGAQACAEAHATLSDDEYNPYAFDRHEHLGLAAKVRWLQGEPPPPDTSAGSRPAGSSVSALLSSQHAAAQSTSVFVAPPPPSASVPSRESAPGTHRSRRHGGWSRRALPPREQRQCRVERLKSEFRLARSARVDALLVDRLHCKPIAAITLVQRQQWRLDAGAGSPTGPQEAVQATTYAVVAFTHYVSPLWRYLHEEKAVLVDMDRTLVDNAVTLSSSLMRRRLPHPSGKDDSGNNNSSGAAGRTSSNTSTSAAHFLSTDGDTGDADLLRLLSLPYQTPRTVEEVHYEYSGALRYRASSSRSEPSAPASANSPGAATAGNADADAAPGEEGSGQGCGVRSSVNSGIAETLCTEVMFVRPGIRQLLMRLAVQWGIPVILVTKSSRTRTRAILDGGLDPHGMLFVDRASQVVDADQLRQLWRSLGPGEAGGGSSAPAASAGPSAALGVLDKDTEKNASWVLARHDGLVTYASRAALAAATSSKHSAAGSLPSASRRAAAVRRTPMSVRQPSWGAQPSASAAAATALLSKKAFSAFRGKARGVAVIDDSPQVWCEAAWPATVSIAPYTLSRVDPADYLSDNGYISSLALSCLFGTKSVVCPYSGGATDGGLSAAASVAAASLPGGVPALRWPHCRCSCPLSHRIEIFASSLEAVRNGSPLTRVQRGGVSVEEVSSPHYPIAGVRLDVHAGADTGASTASSSTFSSSSSTPADATRRNVRPWLAPGVEDVPVVDEAASSHSSSSSSSSSDFAENTRDPLSASARGNDDDEEELRRTFRPLSRSERASRGAHPRARNGTDDELTDSPSDADSFLADAGESEGGASWAVVRASGVPPQPPSVPATPCSFLVPDVGSPCGSTTAAPEGAEESPTPTRPASGRAVSRQQTFRHLSVLDDDVITGGVVEDEDEDEDERGAGGLEEEEVVEDEGSETGATPDGHGRLREGEATALYDEANGGQSRLSAHPPSQPLAAACSSAASQTGGTTDDADSVEDVVPLSAHEVAQWQQARSGTGMNVVRDAKRESVPAATLSIREHHRSQRDEVIEDVHPL